MAVYGFGYLLVRHPGDFVALLGHIFLNYFYEEFKVVTAVRYIDTDLESRIGPQKGHVRTYLSFVPFLVGSLGFLRWRFGNKVSADVCLFMKDIENLFSDAGFVFENAPTKLKYRQSPGVALKILHFLDRPRNCFPSLHVIIASYSYLKTKELVSKYSLNQPENVFADIFLADWSVRIIESCIQTKQHSLRDVAGGLAVVSLRCPQFSKEDIHEMIELLFSGPHSGFAGDIGQAVRENIGSVYSELVIATDKQNGDYRSVFIDYIRSI